MKYIPLLFVVLFVGCASMEDMTEVERAAYIKEQEQKKYDRQEAQDRRMDDINTFIRDCEYAGGVLVTVSRGMSVMDRRGNPKKHARLSDFSCRRPGDIFRRMRY